MIREKEYERLLSTDQFNGYYFPKSFEKERLEKMSIEELSKHQVSQMMKRMRRILKEGK